MAGVLLGCYVLYRLLSPALDGELPSRQSDGLCPRKVRPDSMASLFRAKARSAAAVFHCRGAGGFAPDVPASLACFRQEAWQVFPDLAFAVGLLPIGLRQMGQHRAPVRR